MADLDTDHPDVVKALLAVHDGEVLPTDEYDAKYDADPLTLVRRALADHRYLLDASSCPHDRVTAWRVGPSACRDCGAELDPIPTTTARSVDA